MNKRILALCFLFVAVLLGTGFPWRAAESPAADRASSGPAESRGPLLVPRVSTSQVQGDGLDAKHCDPEDPGGKDLVRGTESLFRGQVTGRVVTSLGDGVGGVTVCLIGDSGVTAHTVADVSGRFRFAEVDGGTYTARALARRDFGCDVRASVSVKAAEVDEVELRLPAATSIRGRAVWPDGSPVAGVLLRIAPVLDPAVVEARAFFDVVGAPDRGGCDADDAPPSLASRSDTEGYFGFAALRPGLPYEVLWLGADGQAIRHSSTVVAGESGLQVVIQQSRLRIEFLDADTGEILHPVFTLLPQDNTSRSFRRQAEQTPFSADSDELDAVCYPGSTKRVVADLAGYELSDTVHTVGAGWGETVARVLMGRLAVPPRLRIECRGPDGDLLDGIGLKFTYEAADGMTLPLDPELRTVDGGRETVDFAGCRVRLETPTLGHDATPLALRHLLPARAVVDVPRSGLVTAVLNLRVGGQLRIRFQGGAKRPIDAALGQLSYKVRDEAGRVYSVGWWYEDESRGAYWMLFTNEAPLSTALPPGAYEISLAPMYERSDRWSAVVPFRVAAGRTTEIDVSLVGR